MTQRTACASSSAFSRRKLIVLLPIILTPILAFFNASLRDPVRAGSADVLMTSGGVASAQRAAGPVHSGSAGAQRPDPGRACAAPRVAQLVIDSCADVRGPRGFPRAVQRLRATGRRHPPSPLRISTDQAARLATIYAREFTEYRNSLDLQAIRSMQQKIGQTLARLAAAGERDTPLYVQLRQAQRRLDAAEAVQGSAAILVQSAVSAAQVRPHPKRDIVLGLRSGSCWGSSRSSSSGWTRASARR